MDRDLVLAQFSKKKRLAVKGYEHFVKERAGQGHVKEIYELQGSAAWYSDPIYLRISNGRKTRDTSD